MEKVTGIGGFFFRARDPKALALWYLQNLGVDLVPENYDQSADANCSAQKKQSPIC